MSKSRKKRKSPKRVLALPDLEQARSAVINSLTSRSGQQTHDRYDARYLARTVRGFPRPADLALCCEGMLPERLRQMG
jgi:hypothetical protein